MKLYYAPGTCSLSPHIALKEAGVDFDLELVDIRESKTASGNDFLEINPLGSVPVLELDDGTFLTEGPAIVQYVADLAPEKGLAPENGTVERYQLQEKLNFITSELHKAYAPLFYDETPENYKPIALNNLKNKYDILEKYFAAGNDYMLGANFSVADCYFYNVSRWGENVGLDITQWPSVTAFMQRMEQRTAVQEVLQAESLEKAAA